MWMIRVMSCIWILSTPVGTQIPQVCNPGPAHNDFPSGRILLSRNRVSDDADHDGRTFLAVGKATITCVGALTEWHVEFNWGRCDNVSLQVWRPTGNAANQYLLVGQNFYQNGPANPNCNRLVQSIVIPIQDQIPVRPNDVVGWRQIGQQGLLMYDENPQNGSATYGRVLSAASGACAATTAGQTCTFTDQYVRDYRIQAHVEIDVEPRFDSLQPPTPNWNFLIREDIPKGALVYKVKASPRTTFTPTLGHTVYYRLDTYKPTSCDQMIEIGQLTGEIRTKVAIDRQYLSTARTCTFTVRTGIDSRLNTTTNSNCTRDVTVTVELLNQPHVFNTTNVPSIIQRDTVNSLNARLLGLVLTDLDYSQPFGPQMNKAYFFSGARPDAAIFRLNDNPSNDNTGQLNCKTDLTYLTESEPRTYDLNITSSDDTHSAGPLSVRVEITNLRLRPVLTVPPFSAVILESETGVPAKSLVNTACKCDSISTYSLRIVHQYPRNESIKFRLSDVKYLPRTAIEVIPGSSFDYDITKKYYIEVEIKDNNISDYLDVQNMTVEVKWVNQAPKFTGSPGPLKATMFEEQAIGTPVPGLVLSATDRDIKYGDSLSLKITGGDPSWANKFYVLPGSDLLYVRSRLDVDPGTANVTVDVTVTVTDQEGLSDTITVLVTIQDINDNAPVFSMSSYQDSIPENTNFTKTIGTFTATDRDAGDNAKIEYSIENEPTGARGDYYFIVDLQSGQLSVKHPMDYEEYTNISFKIKATDKGSPPLSGTMDVFINVEDLNDNRPIFTKPLFNVEASSDSPIHTTVATITATDLDSAAVSQVTYFLLRPDKNFHLSSVSGNISTLVHLVADRKYLLYCYARDNGVNPGELFSDPAIVRIDAFEGGRHLIDITLNIPLQTYQTMRAEFLAKISQIFSPWVAKELISDDVASDGQTVVTLYVLENTATDDLDNLEMAKPFVHRDVLLQKLRENNQGKPSRVLRGDDFAKFRPIRVEPTYPHWFPETQAGVAVVATLCVLAVIAIIVIIILMKVFKVGPFKVKAPRSASRVSPRYEEEFKLNYESKSKPSSKPDKQELPVIVPPKTSVLPSRQTTIRHRPPPPSLQEGIQETKLVL